MKRRCRWLVRASEYASKRTSKSTSKRTSKFASQSTLRSADSPAPYLSHVQISHRSFLLRPLKDVDMHLQYNKITNLGLAIGRIDGIVIGPGEKLSVWKLVGRPLKRKGYLEGLVLHDGKITSGIGGGLCQLGNLLYWMALHTDLEVVQRWRHSYDVFPDVNRTIPFACGATLAYNYIDLELHNPTDRAYCVRLWLDEHYLNGEILCSEPSTHTFQVFETDHQIRQQWWGGFTRHNRIWKRKTALDGTVEAETLVAENHAIMMYNPLIEG